MKKIFSIMAVAALTMGFAACESIPSPYEIFDEIVNGDAEDIYYESSACYTGWNLELGSTQTIQYNPWSQGSSYTQATGYQKWDGADSKSNKEAEGFLVSPKFKTTAKDNNVVFSFDYCIGYAQNDKDFAKHTKLYVSKTYTDGPIDLSQWEQIDWVPTHTSTDWTLANTTNIALPADYQNQDNVHLAFWFYAPAGGSATFEIMNFVMETGETQYVGGGITPDTPDTPSIDAKGSGTAADPFNVAGIIAYTSKLAADVNSDKEVYFTGIVKNFKSGEEPGNQYGNATFYIIDEGGSEDFYCFRVLGKDGKKFTEGADAPAVGDKVTIRGLVVNYKGNTPETVTGKAYVEDIVKGEGSGNTPGGEDTPVVDADTNGDFEAWSGSTPLNWTTTSTAGNATLKQSTDAHGGKYSVEVAGTASANKRLGRKEMKLTAGTYTMTFWTKAATSAGGSVRPGFVPVTDGAVGSYVYGDYTNNLTNDQWVQVTHTFDIPSDGTYSIVIMNSKSPGAAVLIDDFILMKGDTKVISSRRRAARK